MSLSIRNLRDDPLFIQEYGDSINVETSPETIDYYLCHFLMNNYADTVLHEFFKVFTINQRLIATNSKWRAVQKHVPHPKTIYSDFK